MGTNKERKCHIRSAHSVQWMAGFCRTMRDQKNEKTRENMLDHVIQLLDDANDFSWSTEKASHVVFALLNGAGGSIRMVGC